MLAIGNRYYTGDGSFEAPQKPRIKRQPRLECLEKAVLYSTTSIAIGSGAFLRLGEDDGRRVHPSRGVHFVKTL